MILVGSMCRCRISDTGRSGTLDSKSLLGSRSARCFPKGNIGLDNKRILSRTFQDKCIPGRTVLDRWLLRCRKSLTDSPSNQTFRRLHPSRCGMNRLGS